MRIDGVLHDVFNPPQALQEEIVSRIKVMGGMNIAERRLAQDGRATVEVGDRAVDLRISTLPTSAGMSGGAATSMPSMKTKATNTTARTTFIAGPAR